MHFRTLGFILLLSSSMAMAQGRKPAVEDFVGIEIEHPKEEAPQGTEALFNFEKDMTRYEENKGPESVVAQAPASVSEATTSSNGHFGTIFGLALILGLPLVSWLMVMSHLRRKATEASATNIKVFEQYRKEREARKAEEEIRKAS